MSLINKTKSFGFRLVALIAVFSASCDTANTIEPPADYYFVKFYGDVGDQEGVDVMVNPDQTIVLFGNSIVDEVSSLLLIKTDARGDTLWTRTYGGNLFGTASEEVSAKDIELASNGNLVVVADIRNSQSTDIVIAIVDQSGNIQNWNRIGLVDGVGNPTNEEAVSVTEISDGFIISGATSNTNLKPNQPGSGSPGDTRDGIHLRLLPDLSPYEDYYNNANWTVANGYGGDDVIVKTFEAQGGTEFFFFGYSNNIKYDGPSGVNDYNFWIMRISSVGLPVADATTGTVTEDDEMLSSVIRSSAQSGSGYVLAGVTTDGSGQNQMYIAKLREQFTLTSSSDKVFEQPFFSLGTLNEAKVAAFSSTSSGYLILTNEKVEATQNFMLTKISSDGNMVWPDPIIFGGEHDDKIGAIAELQDGKILLLGTMGIGEGETKMTLIKLNKDGKFLK